jgi:hypothetical protein
MGDGSIAQDNLPHAHQRMRDRQQLRRYPQETRQYLRLPAWRRPRCPLEGHRQVLAAAFTQAFRFSPSARGRKLSTRRRSRDLRYCSASNASLHLATPVACPRANLRARRISNAWRGQIRTSCSPPCTRPPAGAFGRANSGSRPRKRRFFGLFLGLIWVRLHSKTSSFLAF